MFIYEVFGALINSLVCGFCSGALGLFRVHGSVDVFELLIFTFYYHPEVTLRGLTRTNHNYALWTLEKKKKTGEREREREREREKGGTETGF